MWGLCWGVWVFSLGVVHRLRGPVPAGIPVPWPGIELASPALEGGFLTTGPPGKSLMNHFCSWRLWFWKPRQQNQSLAEDGDGEGHTRGSTDALWPLLALCQEDTWGRCCCFCHTDGGTMSEESQEQGQGHTAKADSGVLALDHWATCHNPAPPLRPAESLHIYPHFNTLGWSQIINGGWDKIACDWCTESITDLSACDIQTEQGYPAWSKHTVIPQIVRVILGLPWQSSG